MAHPAARKRRLAQVMRKVRARVSSRPSPLTLPTDGWSVGSAAPVSEAVASPAEGSRIQLPRTIRRTEIEQKSRYALHEFLDHHDASFIRCAYLGLLGREPDGSGWDRHLSSLRQGSHTKIEILGRIRYSREGRARGVRVSGLLLPFLVASSYRIPLLGYLLRLPVALVRLPRSAGNTARQEAYFNARIAELESAVDSALSTAERVLQHVDHEQARSRERSDALAAATDAKADTATLAGLDERLNGRLDDSQARIEALGASLAGLAEASATRDAVDSLERRLRGRLEHVEAGSAPRDAVEELSRRLAETAARAVERDAHERLARQLDDLEAAAAHREDLEALTRRLDEAAWRAVDIESHERLARELGETRAAQATLQESTAALASDLRGTLGAELEARLQAALAVKADASLVEDGARRLREEADLLRDARQRIESLEASGRSQQRAILEQQRRHDVLLEETQKRLQQKLSDPELQAILADQQHARDPIYAELEDHFRGRPEEIRERLQEYLPYVADAVRACDRAPLVDIGCGRGEWLALAGDQGWQAIGVDSNRVMVQRCRDDGLTVEEGDALAFLRAAKSDSFSAITGFHIIEHVPFEDVVSLLDEALRTLRPGGVVIFETPNPENLLVGACNFYADPTHRNPIYPPTLEFVVRERGFAQVELLRPWRAGRPESFEPLPAEDPLATRLNPILAMFDASFGASPDFAIIGTKD